MILAFSTKINGKQTYFPEKIVIGLEHSKIITFDEAEHLFATKVVVHKSKKEIATFTNTIIKLDGTQCYKTKLHTIREDKNNRWKAGTKIDFFINVRQKNMFRFAPVLPVLGIQKIEIVYYTDKEVLKNSLPPKKAVAIDGKILNEIEILKLATNDGFDNVDDFFNYFNTDFEGKIIHWTDLKY